MLNVAYEQMLYDWIQEYVHAVSVSNAIWRFVNSKVIGPVKPIFIEMLEGDFISLTVKKVFLIMTPNDITSVTCPSYMNMIDTA